MSAGAEVAGDEEEIDGVDLAVLVDVEVRHVVAARRESERRRDLQILEEFGQLDDARGIGVDPAMKGFGYSQV